MEKKKFVVQVYIKREGVTYASVAVEAESGEEAASNVQRLIDNGNPEVWNVINHRLEMEGCDDEALAEDHEELSEGGHPPDLDLTDRLEAGQ